MFDLEKAITDWRQQIAASGIRSVQVLNELEGHLRDDIGRQVQMGVSAQPAFECSIRRIGESEALAVEFQKAAAPKEIQERKVKLLCIVLVGFLYLLPFILSIPKPWSGLDEIQQWLGLCAIALTILAMFSGLVLGRFLPIISDKRIRTRVQFASFLPVFVWLLAFAFAILPRLDLSVGQMTVATLWAISPLAIFGGLIFGLDEAARRTTSTTA